MTPLFQGISIPQGTAAQIKNNIMYLIQNDTDAQATLNRIIQEMNDYIALNNIIITTISDKTMILGAPVISLDGVILNQIMGVVS